MDAMTWHGTTKQPIEDLMLHAAQDLTDNAYERFVEGQVTQVELNRFYEVLKGWTTASENVLDAMHKIGVQI